MSRKSKARKRLRRERLERDRIVTERYGESGHRQCGRKERYPTEEKALGQATLYQLFGAPALRAYRCPFCGGWHLTSRPKMRRGGHS